MQLKDEKERMKTKEKLKRSKLHSSTVHSQNFASKMLITNRQPARSTPDPGPLPGNIITSWQKNSEVIHYQILKYVCNLIDNIQRCTKVSWKVSAQEEQIPHVKSSIRSGHEERPFLTIISIILWCLERSQEWAKSLPQKRWKTQKILSLL